MATSALPVVIDALLSLANSLETVNVFDGFGVSDDPGDYLMIGVDDPNAVDSANGASSQQSWQHVGHQTRNEEGEIICAALSWNGDGDLKSARVSAFAITALLENALRADPTLGGICLWTGYGTQTDYITSQGDTGAECLVVFRIMFKAYI